MAEIGMSTTVTLGIAVFPRPALSRRGRADKRRQSAIYEGEETGRSTMPAGAAASDGAGPAEFTVADAGVSEVTLNRMNLKQKFGFDLGEGAHEIDSTSVHIVTSVAPASKAAAHLCVWDRVVSLNGHTLDGVPLDMVLALIAQSTTLRLVISRLQEPT